MIERVLISTGARYVVQQGIQDRLQTALSRIESGIQSIAYAALIFVAGSGRKID
ncbi:hypothetical protein [Roseibium porphyridii]|uniref:hypothetical protein n=1 Tax=Roseibium porphyridii TaxID=2866279 RepID=UPI003AAF2F40